MQRRACSARVEAAAYKWTCRVPGIGTKDVCPAALTRIVYFAKNQAEAACRNLHQICSTRCEQIERVLRSTQRATAQPAPPQA
eukprot:705571-Pleurochrysis_carterae.AAC.3